MKPRSSFRLVLLGLLTTACASDDDSAADADTGGAQTGESDATSAAESTSSGGATSSDPSSTSGSEAGDESSESSGESGGDPYACEETMPVLEARPLFGPGYDPKTGLIDPQETYYASATMLLVRPEEVQAFLDLIGLVSAELDISEGMVAYGLAQDPTCGFARTISLWRSQAEMFAFVGSTAHTQAIAQTPEISFTGKTVSWEIDADEIPVTWEAAAAVLETVEPFNSR